MDGRRVVKPAAPAPGCREGRHYHRRDPSRPAGRQWACVDCGQVAAHQPGPPDAPPRVVDPDQEWEDRLLSGVTTADRGPVGPRVPRTSLDLGIGGPGGRS